APRRHRGEPHARPSLGVGGQALEQMSSRTSEIVAAANLALTETLRLDQVLERLLDFVGELVAYDTANVMLLEGERLLVRGMRGYERWTADAPAIRGAGFDASDHPIFSYMIETRQAVLIPDTYRDSGWQVHAGTEYVRSWIGVPLVADREFVGLYALDKAEPG